VHFKNPPLLVATGFKVLTPFTHTYIIELFFLPRVWATNGYADSTDGIPNSPSQRSHAIFSSRHLAMA
jgi:hypothetical protein